MAEFHDEPPMSNLLLVDECLLDARRVNFFRMAIEKVVKPGTVVVDAGTGTGIIALIAAQKGARVYAVERDPEIAEVARKNVKENGFDGKVTVINEDILKFRLSEGKSADVVTMEMLDTGLVAEQQAQAVLAMRDSGIITGNTVLLPDRMDCSLRLVDYDRNFYGFTMPIIIQARNYGVINRIKQSMSDICVYASIDFKSFKSRVVDEKVEIVVGKSGIMNAVELKSNVYLMGKKYAETSDMNMPVIIPLPVKEVTKGDIIKLHISYRMSEGFSKFKLNII